MNKIKTHIILIFSFIFLLISCNNPTLDKEVETSKDTALINNHNDLKYENDTNNCEKISYRRFNKKTDLKLYSNSIKSEFIDTLNFENIKSITLNGISSIPKELDRLKNVERIVFQNIRKDAIIKGLEIFPKLNKLYFFGSSVNLSECKSIYSKIKIISSVKSRLTGFKNISRFNNLKVLDLDYSGFKDITFDIDKIYNIQTIRIYAFLGDKINLRNISIENLDCLEELTLFDVYGTMIGLPKGLLKSKIKKIKIFNNNLTEKEVKILKKATGNNK